MELDRVSLSELDKAREEFPQVHKNLVHLGPERGLFCAKCGTKAQPGGGHGRGFGFSFYYCHTCDEFVEWDDFGMTEEMRTKYRALMRPRLRGEGNGVGKS
jgi:hypothetical protein